MVVGQMLCNSIQGSPSYHNLSIAAISPQFQDSMSLRLRVRCTAAPLPAAAACWMTFCAGAARPSSLAPRQSLTRLLPSQRPPPARMMGACSQCRQLQAWARQVQSQQMRQHQQGRLLAALTATQMRSWTCW